jgi:LysR family transcriptional regulator, hca operon transcriptional activator
MELHHLRYFVTVAEAGSLTVAAEKTLHTAQPSLSRQRSVISNTKSVFR